MHLFTISCRNKCCWFRDPSCSVCPRCSLHPVPPCPRTCPVSLWPLVPPAVTPLQPQLHRQTRAGFPNSRFPYLHMAGAIWTYTKLPTQEIFLLTRRVGEKETPGPIHSPSSCRLHRFFPSFCCRQYLRQQHVRTAQLQTQTHGFQRLLQELNTSGRSSFHILIYLNDMLLCLHNRDT